MGLAHQKDLKQSKGQVRNGCANEDLSRWDLAKVDFVEEDAQEGRRRLGQPQPAEHLWTEPEVFVEEVEERHVGGRLREPEEEHPQGHEDAAVPERAPQEAQPHPHREPDVLGPLQRALRGLARCGRPRGGARRGLAEPRRGQRDQQREERRRREYGLDAEGVEHGAREVRGGQAPHRLGQPARRLQGARHLPVPRLLRGPRALDHDGVRDNVRHGHRQGGGRRPRNDGRRRHGSGGEVRPGPRPEEPRQDEVRAAVAAHDRHCVAQEAVERLQDPGQVYDAHQSGNLGRRQVKIILQPEGDGQAGKPQRSLDKINHKDGKELPRDILLRGETTGC
mmetsp:Transcript_93284/g.273072  ORF Transcript_93284/g.273072 Transcript_93284/m.273072 type:complete len:336 (-) Transcript_93284:577-1584(-)